MPIFITIAIVLVLAALVVVLYPKKQSHHTPTSRIDEESEVRVVVSPVINIEHKEEEKKEIPKMKAKPKKKPQPKKQPAKKTNA